MSAPTYSGNPRGPGGTGVNTTIVLPDDSAGWGSASFDPAYQQLADDVACLEAKAFAGRNWHDTKTWTTGTFGPCGFVWNDSVAGSAPQQWLSTGFSPGGPSTVTPFSVDGTGDVPTGYTAFAAEQVQSIACNPATGDVVTAGWSTGNLGLRRAAAGNLNTFAADALLDTVTTPSDAKVALVAGNFVVALGSTTAANAELGTVAIPVAGGLSNLVTGLSVQTWALKSSGAMCLALPVQIAGATPKIYSTTNGTSWTTTSLASVLATTETPLDVAWSASKQLWLMTVNVGTNRSRFLTSPDGVTWTSIGSTLTSGNAGSVVASGGYWVAAFVPAFGTSWSIIVSPDGLNWTAINTRLTSASGTLALAASPTQLVAWFTVTPSTSDLTYRFSLEAGLPDQAVT